MLYAEVESTSVIIVTFAKFNGKQGYTRNEYPAHRIIMQLSEQLKIQTLTHYC
jgi:hypothetical protein